MKKKTWGLVLPVPFVLCTDLWPQPAESQKCGGQGDGHGEGHDHGHGREALPRAVQICASHALQEGTEALKL